jgi:hypothetical protein
VHWLPSLRSESWQTETFVFESAAAAVREPLAPDRERARGLSGDRDGFERIAGTTDRRELVRRVIPGHWQPSVMSSPEIGT